MARLDAFRRVPVVHRDERQADRSADLAEQREVALPAAFDDRDALAIRVVSERLEHEGERELLRQPLDEDRRVCEEQLAARGIELLRTRGTRHQRARARAVATASPPSVAAP